MGLFIWVLFVVVINVHSGGGISTTTAQFPTKESCLNAGNASIKQSDNDVRIKAWCVK